MHVFLFHGLLSSHSCLYNYHTQTRVCCTFTFMGPRAWSLIPAGWSASPTVWSGKAPTLSSRPILCQGSLILHGRKELRYSPHLVEDGNWLLKSCTMEVL